MTKVLVVYASRQGATGEIARELVEYLTQRGLEADLRPTHQAENIRGYDAVVLGSAVHLRHWDKEAMHFMADHSWELAERPTWLFQSGPYANDPAHQHLDPPHAVTERSTTIGAQGIKVFTGNLAGRLRNCDEIESWANEIADKLISGRVLGAV